jgi:hypothetical protein
MKNTILIILALATAGLTTFCVLQTRKVAQEQKQVAVQRAEAEAKAKALATLEQEQEQNEQHRRDLLRQSDALVAEARAQQVSVSNQLAAKLAGAAAHAESGTAGKEPGGFGSMLSKMMEDPDTRKMLRETQRTMMEQLYGPMAKQIGLTPEEAQKFNDLLADHAMKSTEQASAMFGGLGSSNRTELTTKMGEQQKAFDQEVKALLGDSRYAQYQDYQQTAGERMQLNAYKQQTAGSDHPLTDQQTEQLLGFMKEEKQNVAASTGQELSSTGQNAANLPGMLSGDKLEAFLDGQTQANQRVYDRAKDVLSPDQLAAFGKFQTNQLQMIRLGMSMANKMFAPPAEAPPAEAPGP